MILNILIAVGAVFLVLLISIAWYVQKAGRRRAEHAREDACRESKDRSLPDGP
jgi:hypothetical protein